MKKIAFFIFINFLFFGTVFASNPITLTGYYNTFNYLEEIHFVINNGVIDGRIMPFLLDENNPIDEKAGIINALTANNKTHSNAVSFKQYLARKYREDWQNLDLKKLNGTELFCLGYMTIMDDKGNPENGLSILKLAQEKNPQSYTVNFIYSLAQAQSLINTGKECEAWNTFNKIKTNNTLNNDLNQEVITQLAGIMQSYNNGCN